jgi:hypothetical protein
MGGQRGLDEVDEVWFGGIVTWLGRVWQGEAR